MNAMLRAFGVFLIGCLLLAIVLYIADLIIGLLVLPPGVGHIAQIVIGLLGLLCLVYLCVNAFRGTPGPPFA